MQKFHYSSFVRLWRKTGRVLSGGLVLASAVILPLNADDLPEGFRSVFGLQAGEISFDEVNQKLGKADWWDAESGPRRNKYAKSMCYQFAEGQSGILVVTTDLPGEGAPVDLIELVAPGG